MPTDVEREALPGLLAPGFLAQRSTAPTRQAFPARADERSLFGSVGLKAPNRLALPAALAGGRGAPIRRTPTAAGGGANTGGPSGAPRQPPRTIDFGRLVGRIAGLGLGAGAGGYVRRLPPACTKT
jgi:hypothetical protein